ncbi:MAG: DUF89 family protein [Chitinispirillaceae bacterium]|nr:DUF89 family protein [Chitinispirillaceae bacterium]
MSWTKEDIVELFDTIQEGVFAVDNEFRVTVDDARRVGLDKEAEIISSGCRYPGLMLEETNEAFRDAGVIVAKGQGNYEGLSDTDDERLFFILRIKCDRVANHIDAALGALVLRRKTDLPAGEECKITDLP